MVANKTEVHDVELDLDMSDLGHKVIRCNACELWQPFHQPRRFLLAMEDITQRKQSERQAEALLQSAPDAIVVVDENGTIKFVNQRTVNLFGYHKEELIGQHFDIVLPGRFKCRQPQRLQDSNIADRERLRKSIWKDLFAAHKDGKKIPVDVNFSSIESTDGPLVVGSIRDITERKLIEDELKRHRVHLEDLVAQRTMDLQASNKELESYSYSIAHDLRAPLRAIVSFSQILKNDIQAKLTPDDLTHLDRVIAAGKKMSDLIDDILELSRIARKDIHITDVNLSRIATDIINSLKQSHPNRVVDNQVENDLIVSGDERLLECVLQNLLENAWKFTQDISPSIIQIGALKNSPEPVYFVKDNGIGFDTQYVEKLFQPFHRLHTAEKYEGTGIGLATVKRIIQRHGGRVWAESEKGRGATFYFSLPLKSH
jgi:PAS domain S-box-containing protein